ncbi:MAG: type II toxin-antitoxin system RelE/ParE family toxin [Candidatus Omnitrophota bacterium]|jgi:putative addiction module killer protein|nr:MAG: type II toxin-antitoxin system RelE/ParE family toxin [Candidatus Omnitrophota bacterium]
MKKQIIIFSAPDGKQPFVEWMEAIRTKDQKTYLRILDRIDRIAEFGTYGDCKPVDNGVFELRFFFGPGYRVYFGEEGDAVVLLLCGGVKRTQEKDIKRAKEFWKTYHD